VLLKDAEGIATSHRTMLTGIAAKYQAAFASRVEQSPHIIDAYGSSFIDHDQGPVREMTAFFAQERFQCDCVESFLAQHIGSRCCGGAEPEGKTGLFTRHGQ